MWIPLATSAPVESRQSADVIFANGKFGETVSFKARCLVEPYRASKRPQSVRAVPVVNTPESTFIASLECHSAGDDCIVSVSPANLGASATCYPALPHRTKMALKLN